MLVHLSSCLPSSARYQVRWCWTGLPPPLAFWSGSTLDCSIWVTRHTWWGTAFLQLWHLTASSASKGTNRSMIRYRVCIWNGEGRIPALLTLYAVLGQWSPKFWPQKSFSQLSKTNYHVINNVTWIPAIVKYHIRRKFYGRKFCNFVQSQRYCGLYFATFFKISLVPFRGENFAKWKSAELQK